MISQADKDNALATVRGALEPIITVIQGLPVESGDLAAQVESLTATVNALQAKLDAAKAALQ